MNAKGELTKDDFEKLSLAAKIFLTDSIGGLSRKDLMKEIQKNGIYTISMVETFKFIFDDYTSEEVKVIYEKSKEIFKEMQDVVECVETGIITIGGQVSKTNFEIYRERTEGGNPERVLSMLKSMI